MPEARHVEIQVFGFGDDNAIHLFERDCSLQRRFQKVIEESPAPGLPAKVRRRMAQTAVLLCAHTRYSGAGTVEFIVDADTFEFFFLEMNTRIQSIRSPRWSPGGILWACRSSLPATRRT